MGITQQRYLKYHRRIANLLFYRHSDENKGSQNLGPFEPQNLGVRHDGVEEAWHWVGLQRPLAPNRKPFSSPVRPHGKQDRRYRGGRVLGPSSAAGLWYFRYLCWVIPDDLGRRQNERRRDTRRHPGGSCILMLSVYLSKIIRLVSEKPPAVIR